MSEIEEKAAALGARVAARQAAAEKAMTDRDQEFLQALGLLRETFGATLTAVRAPEIQYGRNPFEGMVRVRPSPPAIRWIKRGSKRVAVVAYTQSK